MKIMVTGAKGQLGYDVVKELIKRRYDAIAVDIEEMDITDVINVNNVIKKTTPDAIIHCSAWTAVDLAEDNEVKCREVNAGGTENIAKVCKEQDLKMIYISTDYVFNGQGTHYWDTDNSEIDPVNVYGQTKYEGELVVQNLLEKYFIVRTSWVFGQNGNNFVKTILELGNKRKEINVVNDQYGSPTYTCDLARLLVDMVETDQYGIYQATNEGICTWYEFASEIFKQTADSGCDKYRDIIVHPVASDRYPTKAKRPSNSRMSKEKLSRNGFERLPHWKDALKRYLQQMEV